MAGSARRPAATAGTTGTARARRRRGWILLVLLGPPVYLALDWAGSVLFDDETGTVCGRRFSFVRFAAAVAVILGACGTLAWFLLFA